MNRIDQISMSTTYPSPPPDTQISTEEYAALSKSFKCLHENAKPRWRNKQKQMVWLQCLNCGSAVGKSIKQSTLSPSEFSSLEMWDETLVEKRYEFRTQAYESIKQEKDLAWRDWYNSYLKSDAWKVKRKAVLARENGWCQGCREKPATQVHHLSYRHVGNELLFELAAVCNDCHDAAHSVPQPGTALEVLQTVST